MINCQRSGTLTRAAVVPHSLIMDGDMVGETFRWKVVRNVNISRGKQKESRESCAVAVSGRKAIRSCTGYATFRAGNVPSTADLPTLPKVTLEWKKSPQVYLIMIKSSAIVHMCSVARHQAFCTRIALSLTHPCPESNRSAST